MTKIEISSHVETALEVLENFVIKADHDKYDSRGVIDAIRILREIPRES